jgi:hypothetical protein
MFRLKLVPSRSDARQSDPHTVILTTCLMGLAMLVPGCGGATQNASAPHGRTSTTSGTLGQRVDRLLVSEGSEVLLVTRGGCVALVRTIEGGTGSSDELRVLCPKPERLAAWFDAADKVIARIPLAPIRPASARKREHNEHNEDDADDDAPMAKVLTASGQTLRVVAPADVKKLSVHVHALSAELAAAENVSPGPASPAGWQMLHVMGPAHVVFAGTPAHGVFEARMSTTGQYLCEFLATVGDGPLRATKSGWLSPAKAMHAIDEVLVPFKGLDANDKSSGGYAAATGAGGERRSSPASTAAVFERFSHVQDELGDACLPELEAPALASTVSYERR